MENNLFVPQMWERIIAIYLHIFKSEYNNY